MFIAEEMHKKIVFSGKRLNIYEVMLLDKCREFIEKEEELPSKLFDDLCKVFHSSMARHGK